MKAKSFTGFLLTFVDSNTAVREFNSSAAGLRILRITGHRNRQSSPVKLSHLPRNLAKLYVFYPTQKATRLGTAFSE